MNSDESLIVINKYQTKLIQTLSGRDVIFKFGKFSLIKKQAVDDILCCIEASFSDEYQATLQKRKSFLLSNIQYTKLKQNLTQPFLLDKSIYIYKIENVIDTIKDFYTKLKYDYQRLNEQ